MLQIYNTFTKRKEIFTPIIPGEISLYVCGITVYDYCHIGHARVFVAFDAIVRFLRASGWKVNYVCNITDVDDKIIKRARENNESTEALTARFIAAMGEDMQALNVVPADKQPRATAHMPEIIGMVSRLLDNQVAYIAENKDIYFQVDKYASYGQLAHKDLEQLQSGARVDVVEVKRSPLDFVLWKQAKENEISWPSPWGAGRPGWHIECSAMSTACLGNTFDIHGGGADLVFPHHENERAQSECATGKPFVNTWMHVGFVQIDKEKMSKSLNNFFTIREVLAEYEAEVVRYFLLASHYHSPVNYSTAQLEQAKSNLSTFYTVLRGLKFPDNTDIHGLINKADKHYEDFFEAMNDDFNTPVALSVLFDLVRILNHSEDKTSADFIAQAALLKFLGNILGILENDPNVFLQGKDADRKYIETQIALREKARQDKNWAKADEIRQALLATGIVLDDTPVGTTWRKE